jgi:hypothetical protein
VGMCGNVNVAPKCGDVMYISAPKRTHSNYFIYLKVNENTNVC